VLHVGRMTLAISRFVSRNRILCEAALTQGLATYGQPSKIIRLADPLANCSNCMARLVVLHFTILPSLQLIE